MEADKFFKAIDVGEVTKEQVENLWNNLAPELGGKDPMPSIELGEQLGIQVCDLMKVLLTTKGLPSVPGSPTIPEGVAAQHLIVGSMTNHYGTLATLSCCWAHGVVFGMALARLQVDERATVDELDRLYKLEQPTPKPKE